MDKKPGRLLQEKESDSNVDIEKIIYVFKKNLPVVLIIFCCTLSAAFLYLRYTKPVFESYSDLKLDIKNQASMLNIAQVTPENEFMDLSGEIELIRSKLLFNQLIKVLDLDVSYFNYGKILDEEKYKNSPFTIDYKLKNSALYNNPIDITISEKGNITISYQLLEKERTYNCQLNTPVSTPDIDLIISTTSFFNSEFYNKKMYFVVNSNEALISYIEKNLKVEPLNLNANTIRVSFTDYNKFKAKDFVNTIDTLYLNYLQETKKKANRQKIDFLNEQMYLTDQKLEEYENYFENFTIKNRSADVQADISKKIKELEKLDSIRFNLKNHLSKISELQKQVETENIVLNPVTQSHYTSEINESLKKLNDLVEERKILLTSYNENTFVVQKKNEKIGLQKNKVLDLIRNHKKQVIEEINNSSTHKNLVESNFITLPSKSTEFGKSKRYYSLYEEFYLTMMKIRAELEIEQAGTVTNFVILSAASLPNTPIAPVRLWVYGIGLIGGFFLSIILLLVSYLFHNKINSLSELEKLSTVPVLGVAPFIRSDGNEHSKIVVDKNPRSAVSEALRSVRTNLDFMITTKTPRVISVTSTISGEGKTFVAINLGAVIALSKQKVIVLDLDMRKPKVHLGFGDEETSKGLSTLIIKKHEISEVVKESSTENLYYIPAGPIPPNPSELLLQDHFNEILIQLKKNFDVIIMDTPPVGLVTDGILAMQKSDLNIYVVRADYTKKVFLKSLNKLIKMNGFNNIALILNALNYKYRKNYGYGYGYNNYYQEEKKEKPLKFFKKLLNHE